MKSLPIIVSLFVVAFTVAPSSATSAAGDTNANAIERTMIDDVLRSGFRPATLRKIDERRAVWQGVRKIYENTNMQALWTGSRAARKRAGTLIGMLNDASRHGLVPQEYDAVRFAALFDDENFSRLKVSTSMDAAEIDIALTTALLAYAHDMWDGRVEPADIRSEHEVYLERQPIDAETLLASIREVGIESALQALQPQHPAYAALTRQMEKALAAEASGGYTRVSGRILKRGDKGGDVYDLMQRLRQGGHLDTELPREPATAEYTAEVENAIRKVQQESALKEDGIAGPATAAILNRTRDDRVRRLAINLDRWRWLPRDMGDHYLWVNIPDYKLRAYKNGKEQWSMPVVTGTSVHRTPVFADKLEYIVFSPSWHVPKSIIGNELIPMFREDPGRVEEKNMEITNADGDVLDPHELNWEEVSAADVDVRQKPGPSNALGRVKFIFPNRYAIYLHDTPSDHLFGNSKRSFSHGCIRVAEPARLADYLLSDQDEWTRANIESAMRAEEEEKVWLSDAIPVYITYFTAMPEADGELRLLADVYEHDRLMDAALNAETPRVRISTTSDVAAR